MGAENLFLLYIGFEIARKSAHKHFKRAFADFISITK